MSYIPKQTASHMLELQNILAFHNSFESRRTQFDQIPSITCNQPMLVSYELLQTYGKKIQNKQFRRKLNLGHPQRDMHIHETETDVSLESWKNLHSLDFKETNQRLKIWTHYCDSSSLRTNSVEQSATSEVDMC